VITSIWNRATVFNGPEPGLRKRTLIGSPGFTAGRCFRQGVYQHRAGEARRGLTIRARQQIYLTHASLERFRQLSGSNQDADRFLLERPRRTLLRFCLGGKVSM